MYTTQISYPAIAKVWPPVSLEGMSNKNMFPQVCPCPPNSPLWSFINSPLTWGMQLKQSPSHCYSPSGQVVSSLKSQPYVEWPLQLLVHISQVINIKGTNVSFTISHVCITLLPHKNHIGNFLGIILTITYSRTRLGGKWFQFLTHSDIFNTFRNSFSTGYYKN